MNIIVSAFIQKIHNSLSHSHSQDLKEYSNKSMAATLDQAMSLTTKEWMNC